MNNNSIYKFLIKKENTIKIFKYLKSYLISYLMSFLIFLITFLLTLSLYSYFFVSLNLESKSFFFVLIYILIIFIWTLLFFLSSIFIGLKINSLMDSNQIIKIFFKNKISFSVKLPWNVFNNIKKIDKIIILINKGEKPLDVVYKIAYIDC